MKVEDACEWLNNNCDVSLNTLAGEEASDIVQENSDADPEMVRKCVDEIQDHLWVYFDNEWCSSGDNPITDDDFLRSLEVREFDENIFGYPKLATDEPVIFEYWDE